MNTTGGRSQWQDPLLWMEGLVAVAVVIGLYGLIPYNFGFESQARSVFEMLGRFWTDPSTADWHHGMIVPLISVGLILHRAKELEHVVIRPCRWGLGLVGAALALFWVGYKVDITIVGFLSRTHLINQSLTQSLTHSLSHSTKQ